jgi:hypothetical protein
MNKIEKEPWGFCETPEEKCTLNYCDENGCLNRKRDIVEPVKMTEEILIPVIPNVECRDGKEIGVWMEGWLEGYKEAQGQYDAKVIFYTEEQVKEAIRLAHSSNRKYLDWLENDIIQSLKKDKL